MSAQVGQIGLGSIISIGAVSGTTGTETFATVGKVMSAKSSGASASVTKYNTLDSVYTNKIAAVRDAGTWDLQIVHNSADAGQTALATAFANIAGPPYDFKVVLPLNAGQVTNGDTLAFSAIISKYNPISSIEVDKIIMSEVTLDLVVLPIVTPGS